MYQCEVLVPISNTSSDVICDAIVPELMDVPDNRAKVEISKIDESLRLDISANDITSLRSAVNSYLRYIKLSLDTLEVK